MNTKKIGERTEAIILAELLKLDKVVLLPWGDNQRFDFVVLENDCPIKIQCKTAHKKNGCVVFDARGGHSKRGSPRLGYGGDADIFAVYSPDTDSVYWVPVADAPRGCCLRIDNPIQEQSNIRWAEDYGMWPTWQGT